jgi:hypothetical protein
MESYRKDFNVLKPKSKHTFVWFDLKVKDLVILSNKNCGWSIIPKF